ncbi:MAG TPA: hypothetical protein VEX40_10380 [Mycobacterium sp.]|nr:hypothetical protein [Mycobacterium sp.]
MRTTSWDDAAGPVRYRIITTSPGMTIEISQARTAVQIIQRQRPDQRNHQRIGVVAAADHQQRHHPDRQDARPPGSARAP